MLNNYYSDSITFLTSTDEEIIGKITIFNKYDTKANENMAWLQQIKILKTALINQQGHLYFEFSVTLLPIFLFMVI